MTRSAATLRIQMAKREPEDAARALLECLGVLQEVLKRLEELAGQKLDALRHADTEALQRCAAEESSLLERVQVTKQQRKAILARLAQSLRWRGAATACLTEIADRLGEPFSSSIRARTVPLREIAARLEEKNRLAARVAHDLQKHVRGIFADLAKLNQESVVYGPEGQPAQTTARSWVDAVG